MDKPGDKSDRDFYEKLSSPDFLGRLALNTAIVVASLVLTFFIIVFQVGWGDFEAIKNLSSAFAPFILVLLGAVTFTTVLWRGSIQRAAVDQHDRENNIKDEENIAQLLETATARIAQGDRLSQSLGLTMLGTIVRAPSPTYAAFAMEIICNQIVPSFKLAAAETADQLRQIEAILKAAREMQGRRPTRRYEINLSEGEFPHLERNLILFEDFPMARIRGAYIHINKSVIEVLNKRNDLSFTNSILEAPIQAEDSLGFAIGPPQYTLEHVDGRFSDSTISRIRISRVSTLGGLIGPEHGPVTSIKFSQCDLSGTQFDREELRDGLTFENCRYKADDPPRFGPDFEPIDEVFPEGIEGILPYAGFAEAILGPLPR